jgi:acetyl esterase/lipase
LNERPIDHRPRAIIDSPCAQSQETALTEDLSVLTRPSAAPDLTVAYGVEADQVADVRHGKDAAASRPLVIVIHGGFWRPIYDRAHTGPMAAALADAGWTVAAIEYRRIPGNPHATVRDVGLAVERLASLVEHHNGEIVLMGHSAGGHLVLWAGAMSGSRNLIGIVALAPAADLQLAQKLNLGDGAVRLFLGGAAESCPDLDPQLLRAPDAAVTIIHGELDDTVTLEVSQSYAAKHPRTRLVPLPGVGHFAVIDPLSDAWPTVVAELRRVALKG